MPYMRQLWDEREAKSRAAVEAADRAFHGPWSRLTATERGHRLWKLGELIQANAARLAETGRVKVLAGVNLPMLVRAICYRAEKLDQLATKALAGGAQGVLQVGTTAVQNQTANHPDKYAAEGHHHHQ